MAKIANKQKSQNNIKKVLYQFKEYSHLEGKVSFFAEEDKRIGH